MTRPYSMMIGGRKVDAARTFAVNNPSTGEVVGHVPDASIDDLNAAVTAANEAFNTWSAQSDEQLQAACEAVTAKLGEHAEEIAQLVTLEQGKPLNGLG